MNIAVTSMTLLLIMSVALAGVQITGSGNVTDSNGTKIGEYSTQGNGEFFDYSDDPSSSHPPDENASASWSIPDPNDQKYDTTKDGRPDGYTIEFFVYSYPAGESGKRTHSWTKKDRQGNIVDSGYLESP